MVAMVKQARDRSGLDTKSVCRAGNLPYASVRRWEKRQDAGLAPVLPPGPRPVAPADWAGLLGRILALHHGRKRTRGTGGLVAQYRGKASRRRIRAMVREVRELRNRQLDAALRRLQWHRPGAVWATDTTEILIPGFGKVQVQTIRDLASRYLMAPALDHDPNGAEVAARIDAHAREHGAPLFLKLDNAGNENAPEVLAVLDKWGIIPLNSPKAYPQYNGAVEEAQGEIQGAFAAFLARNPEWRPDAPGILETVAGNVAHNLNHNGRDVLRGKCSCRTFDPGRKRSMFTRRYRKEVADTITRNAAVILGGTRNPTRNQAAKAWRLAAEQWLLDAGFLTEKAS